MSERRKIAINNSGQTFFYTGLILKEKEDFILFKDDKVGLIELNKVAIISIQHLGGYNG